MANPPPPMVANRPKPFSEDQDPGPWSAVLCVFFLALVWNRLGIPGKIYFDEIHYVTAARKLLAGEMYNPEHPMLGKDVLALAIHWLGDKPLYWRVPSALLGTWGLYAVSRLVWFLSGRFTAAILALLLVATDFMWFIQSRIAMLDMTMASLGVTALWLFVSAIRRPDQGRLRLAGAGIAFGLSMGAKWNILPAAVLPGLLFLALKIRDCGRRFVIAREGGPVPGITLIEAALWLGAIPLAVYWLTYWPAFFYARSGIDWHHPIAWHEYMLRLQDSVVKLHPYRTVWYEWMIDWRGIWYLYENVDGAQRGIVMLGNPFTMIIGLPALLWGLWAGMRRQRWDALALVVLYAVTLGMWIVSGKPIQFYYHYMLPSTFMMGCLALFLEPFLKREDAWWWLPPVVLGVTALIFIYFYPIISAAALDDGPQSFTHWMWLKSWR